MNRYDVIVVGAGAAGLMAAGTAAQKGLRVLLLEKNKRPGRKILISGKGRCNVTNDCTVEEVIAAVVSNGKFLYSALNRFPPAKTLSFFEALGVPLKTERGRRVFPESDRAADIVDALTRYARTAGVSLVTDSVRRVLYDEKSAAGVFTASGERYAADQVILACGGVSYPATGSTGDGYRFAEDAGHTIIKLRPSLVPVVETGEDCAKMQGLSLRNCAVRVYDRIDRKMIYEDFGELLFTHFGLSGPVVLSAGSHIRQMEPERYEFQLDLKPALSETQLDLRLLRELAAYQNRNFIHALHTLLPQKMLPVIVERSGVPAAQKCNTVTKAQRRTVVALLKKFIIPIRAFRPIQEAIVTAGGVCTDEINPGTMESKLKKGLFFAGEMIDVDAYTGGYNLQIAFSTGHLAGRSVKRRENDDSSCD